MTLLRIKLRRAGLFNRSLGFARDDKGSAQGYLTVEIAASAYGLLAMTEAGFGAPACAGGDPLAGMRVADPLIHTENGSLLSQG